ncbi:hypothetical protein [Limnobacter sp. P1]|uniref:hypothetical protein n=1 Tax=Limnobacter olei TaxID=3031298 RepID=UPI0023B119EC|nr:hypothetical protein [Limnobacter sp. P1]
MTYLAQIIRPTACCKSDFGIGDVVKVQMLQPSDGRWFCSVCKAFYPPGEVMAYIKYPDAIPAYRLKNLPPPDQVEQYDNAPLEAETA